MLPEEAFHNDGLTLACAVCGRTFRRSGRRVFCSEAPSGSLAASTPDSTSHRADAYSASQHRLSMCGV
jgi:hypothetical protein